MGTIAGYGQALCLPTMEGQPQGLPLRLAMYRAREPRPYEGQGNVAERLVKYAAARAIDGGGIRVAQYCWRSWGAAQGNDVMR
jgi:hypothetical protein